MGKQLKAIELSLLHDKQDSDILAAAFVYYGSRIGVGIDGFFRYMLTNDSASEQTAVIKAFHFSNEAKRSTSNNGCKPFLQPIETGYPISST